ncbi:glycosyltransferase family 4 protein [Geobacter sp. DSM 9736]|uniref:glycosyltransferase family 4 protein n=1 Tax=Geobacter sp. DSM 9736 TaxID=1277350 RepID=UPI000B5092AF|nr:glycosyltransferase family 4 protein [Geobacter sp. DSM 9736]SNB45060.1 Glycosyltransferase involved in cell wall bisynthesis [Geobacter sp. DSM 9736]
MKILILTTKFCHPDGSPWLVSELTDEFTRLGHQVTVLNVEWTRSSIQLSDRHQQNDNLEVNIFQAIHAELGMLSVAIRWALSSFKALPFLLKRCLSRERYDLMIGFSPCTALYAILPLARSISHDSCLIYWDFFPVHNQEISGKAPTFSLPILKFVENKLVGLFSRVGCMSDKNLEFFNRYFGAVQKQQRSIIPIWTSFFGDDPSSRPNPRFAPASRKVVLVFGGQLVEGRGVIELCEAVIMAHREDPDISLVICGAGFLSSRVLELQERYPAAIRYAGQLSREAYFGILGMSHIGVVATVSNVSVPTFPSKSLDYMACGLPILASVEAASDFGDFVEKNNIGKACPAGDIASMKAAILEMATSGEKLKIMGNNGNRYLRANHSVQHVAHLIIGD